MKVRWPWHGARLTVIVLVGWAVIAVLWTSLAVGHYEHRITVVTHGEPDVWPAWLAYEALDSLLPHGALRWAIGGWLVLVGNLVIPYVMMQYLRRAGGPARRSAPVGWWATVLITLLLNGLIHLYDVATTRDGVFKKTALDTRAVAYPLWTAGVVAVVIMAFLGVRIVRRISAEQRRIGEAAWGN